MLNIAAIIIIVAVSVLLGLKSFLGSFSPEALAISLDIMCGAWLVLGNAFYWCLLWDDYTAATEPTMERKVPTEDQ